MLILGVHITYRRCGTHQVRKLWASLTMCTVYNYSQNQLKRSHAKCVLLVCASETKAAATWACLMGFGAYFHPLTKCHTGDDVKHAQRRSLMWTLASGGVRRGGQLLWGTLRISRGESGSALRTLKRPRFSLSTTGSDILSYYASKLGGNTMNCSCQSFWHEQSQAADYPILNYS